MSAALCASLGSGVALEIPGQSGSIGEVNPLVSSFTDEHKLHKVMGRAHLFGG